MVLRSAKPPISRSKALLPEVPYRLTRDSVLAVALRPFYGVSMELSTFKVSLTLVTVSLNIFNAFETTSPRFPLQLGDQPKIARSKVYNVGKLWDSLNSHTLLIRLLQDRILDRRIVTMKLQPTRVKEHFAFATKSLPELLRNLHEILFIDRVARWNLVDVDNAHSVEKEFFPVDLLCLVFLSLQDSGYFH